MLKNNTLFKNTVIIGIGTICTKFISFMMVPLYTMWLLPEEYGNYDLIVSYLSLLIPIITFQLEQAIFRFSLKNTSESKKYFLNSFIFTLFNILIIDIIAYFILYNSLFKISFILYVNVYAIFVLLSEYLRGNNKLKEYSGYNIVTTILIVITNFGLVYGMKFGAVGLMYSYAISYFIVDIFIIIKEKIYDSFKKENLNQNILKDMLKYSMPLIPNGISWWVTNVSDRTMIKLFIGSFYNGLYAVSCKIPTIMSLIYSVFNLSWQQTAILINDEKDKKDYYTKIFKKLIYFLFSCGIIIISVLPFIYKILINELYYDSISQVPYLLLGAIFLSLAQFLSGILLAQNDTKSIGKTTVLAAIINIVVNMFFMKKCGVIIAAISTLMSYLYLFINRYKLVDMGEKFKNILIIIVMTIVYGFISVIVVYINNFIVNIILIFITSILAIILNRELIEMVLKKFLMKINKGQR